MKDIKDYATGKYSILITNKDEYKEICKVLNTFFRCWRDHKFDEYRKELSYFYINLEKDQVAHKTAPEGHTILQAYEFLKPKEQVINQYDIY